MGDRDPASHLEGRVVPPLLAAPRFFTAQTPDGQPPRLPDRLRISMQLVEIWG